MNSVQHTIISIFQQLPDFKGKRRLAKWLLAGLINSEKNTLISGKENLKYKLPNLVETVGFEILINGMYEKETSDFIISQLPKGGRLLDIGGNIGAVIVPVLHKRKDIVAVSIEASPRIFAFLQENIRMNNLVNVTLINKAITDTSGLKVSFFSPESNYGKGSLSASFTDKAEEVDTIMLDDLCSGESNFRPDFIKIDVEGYEYFVFKGGAELLQSPQAPDILLEFVDWAEANAGAGIGSSQQILLDYGYSIYKFENGWQKNQLISTPLTSGASMLFATKNNGVTPHE
jgi:FkbM family methyltransferase